jgi:hypothetical protein
MRKRLYPYPPADTINDDFVIPTSVVAHGYRIAYDPSAIASEEAREMEGFGRRVRVMAGNVKQLQHIGTLLGRPFVLFCFLSHKAARLLAPLALVALALSSAWLWDVWPYAWIAAGQVAFYSLAVAAAVRLPRWKILRLPFYFCMINAALVVWICRAVARRTFASAHRARPSVAWT